MLHICGVPFLVICRRDWGRRRRAPRTSWAAGYRLRQGWNFGISVMPRSARDLAIAMNAASQIAA